VCVLLQVCPGAGSAHQPARPPEQHAQIAPASRSRASSSPDLPEQHAWNASVSPVAVAHQQPPRSVHRTPSSRAGPPSHQFARSSRSPVSARLRSCSAARPAPARLHPCRAPARVRARSRAPAPAQRQPSRTSLPAALSPVSSCRVSAPSRACLFYYILGL